MIPAWRECTDCGRRWKVSECLLVDDPQAPLGPERLCPRCEGLTVVKVHPALLWTGIALAILAGRMALRTLR
jgi:hypothetical protein